MKVNVEKQPKSTLKVTITVPVEKVKEAYEKLFEEVVQNAELAGFRKGKAPKELVKEKADVSKIYGNLVDKLLQTYYPQALKENHIHAISNPKVEIKEFDIEKDFEFVATVATRPDIKIGDYKTELKKIKEEKENKLKETNTEKLQKGEPIQTDHIHVTTNDVLEAIIKTSEVEVPDIIIDDESERMLARLVDQAQSVGLSLEQYLKAQNKNADELRKEYATIAERNIKAEFALSELISKENIAVTEEEIIEAYKAAGTEYNKADFDSSVQKWYIKGILEKNKLIAKIVEEFEPAQPKDLGAEELKKES